MSKLTAYEAKWLSPLIETASGRPANVYDKPMAKDVLSELSRKGFVKLDAARSGLFHDPDTWWVTITDAGREALAAMSAYQ